MGEWQYVTLRARAESEGRSLSDLIRELLRKTLTETASRSNNRLDAMEGVREDAAACGDNLFSFTDCTSFPIMRRLGLSSALALDDDFRADGVTVMPLRSGPTAPFIPAGMWSILGVRDRVLGD